MKKVGQFLVVFLLFASAIILFCNVWMLTVTHAQIKTSFEQLQSHPVGLILGTSKYSSKGQLNPFYTERINGAVQLFEHHKIAMILVSGDNRFANYNEPINMWRDLLKAGIPSDKIVLDYAGFRTLDSIIRAKKVFDVTNMVIITQKFHCPRALYLAHYYGIHAECYAVPPQKISLELSVREIFARVLSFIDLYLLHTQPHFLGPSEPISIPPSS